MSSSSLEAACLGKLPTHGDFVRHRTSTPTMRAFDEWIRKGLYRVRKRFDQAWEAAYDRAPLTRFLVSGHGPQARNALLGVLHTSRDRSGRTYPFTVTCELPKASLQADHLPHLPLRAASFYAAAEQVVQDATDGTLPYHEVPDRVAQISPTVSLSPSAPTEYTRYTQRHTIGMFLERLFDHFEDSRKYRLLNNLLEVLLPQRDRTTPRLNYGLEFPLGENESAFTTTACFWLDATRRLLNRPDTEFSFFWTPHSSDSAPTFLLLFIGRPRSEAFFHLLLSADATEDICKLAHRGSQNTAPAARSLPEKYGTLLENRQLLLHDFLQRL